MKTLTTHYRLVIGITVFLLLSSAIFVNAILTAPPAMRTDTAFYQHAGWYISQGAIPYVNIWDVKPPLHFEMQALLALLSGGDMLVLHWLNIIISSLCVVGTVYFTAEIIKTLTRDKLAALAGALTILSFSYVYLFASMGFRNKLYVVCAGTASLWFQLKNRPLSSGILSSIALGFWQFGIIFPAMNLLMAYNQLDRRAVRRTIIGILFAGFLMLLPVFYWGAFSEMIVEAVIVPTLMTEPFNPLSRIITVVLWSDVAILIFSCGILGATIHCFGNHDPPSYWFTVGFLGSLFQVFVVDLDSFPDAYLLLVFTAIGLGLLFQQIDQTFVSALFVLIVLSLVLNWGLHLGKPVNDSIGITRLPDKYKAYLRTVDKPAVDLDARRFTGEWQNNHYWSKRVPEQCHYRLSTNEKEWMVLTEQPITTQQCGKFDYVARFLWE